MQGARSGAGASGRTGVLKALLSPAVVLLVALALCALVLIRPLHLPLGPMYWDLALYLDVDNRIRSGQWPLVDFLTPVGPLGYWLYSGLATLFPNGQPLLLAQWSPMLVTVPALALVLCQLDSRRLALGLLLPFLVFQLLPVNVEHHSFYPGVDGYGIYNRQSAIILYVLVAALVFVRSQALLAVLLVWTLAALFLLKITAFLAGGLVVAVAFFMGRIGWRPALLVTALFGALLLALELRAGTVCAYVSSIADLVALNAGGILPRFLQAASLHLDIVGAGTALVLALLALTRREIAAALSALRRERSLPALQRLLDRDVVWLAATLFAGLFFETQNTGGQAFVFVWPVLLLILRHWLGSGRRGALVVCALVAATAIPPAETVLQRAGRAALAQTGYESLPNDHLGQLGLVSQHREVIARAQTVKSIYVEERQVLERFAAEKLLPSHSFYSELDFQAIWLMAIDDGIAAILAHEARTGVRFETIMNLNFANAFPYLMGRKGVRHIAIGADPFRAVPVPDARTLASVAAADLILYPLCPVTVANQALRESYRPALSGRREIALGACWTGYDKP